MLAAWYGLQMKNNSDLPSGHALGVFYQWQEYRNHIYLKSRLDSVFDITRVDMQNTLFTLRYTVCYSQIHKNTMIFHTNIYLDACQVKKLLVKDHGWRILLVVFSEGFHRSKLIFLKPSIGFHTDWTQMSRSCISVSGKMFSFCQEMSIRYNIGTIQTDEELQLCLKVIPHKPKIMCWLHFMRKGIQVVLLL